LLAVADCGPERQPGPSLEVPCPAVARAAGTGPRPAVPRLPRGERRARAVAGVDIGRATERLERRLVRGAVVRLPERGGPGPQRVGRGFVGSRPEPVQVIEQ